MSRAVTMPMSFPPSLPVSVIGIPTGEIRKREALVIHLFGGKKCVIERHG